MLFLYRKSLFKIVFGQNVFNCQPILKIFAAYVLGQSKHQVLQGNSVPIIIFILEKICEIPPVIRD